MLLTLQCYVLYFSYMALFLLPQGYMVSFWFFTALAHMQHWRARIKPVSRVRMRVLVPEQRCLFVEVQSLH